MKTYQLGVMHGDGIGREVIEATLAVLEAANQGTEQVKLKLENLPMGLSAIDRYGHPLPEQTKEKLAQKDGWIMGPHDSAAYPERFKTERNPSGELRHYFDLFANIRPAKSLKGINGLVNEADIIIYRENTEGYYPDRNMYSGVGEWMVTPDVAVSSGVFTKKAIERIARAAFEAAMKRKKQVTIVHKANVIRLGTGLFKDVCYEVAKEYPEVEVNDFHVDAMAAHLVKRMSDFDIIVTENMFGDILSDLTGELVGGLGLSPAINANESQAMAQAVHGSAPDIVGQEIANPVGVMLSTVMLLEWLANKHHDKTLLKLANKIENGILTTLEKGETTPDLGGTKSTQTFTEAVIKHLN